MTRSRPPNSHRGARRAFRCCSGRRRAGAGPACLARLPRQSVQPRRAAGGSSAPGDAAGSRGSRAWRRPIPATSSSASTASRARCASSPAPSSSCSIRNQQLRDAAQAHAGRHRIPLPAARLARAAAAGAQPRAMPPQSPAGAPPPAAPGRRSDVFDPAQHPNAPGAPRVARQRSGRPPRSRIARTSRRSARPAAAPPARRSICRRLPAIRRRRSRRTRRWRNCRADAAAPQLPPPPRAQLQRRPAPQLATLPPSATPQDEYDLAYGYVLHKDYALAEQAFRDFLTQISERPAGAGRAILAGRKPVPAPALSRRGGILPRRSRPSSSTPARRRTRCCGSASRSPR